jgi:hypothetical protein
MSPKLSAEVAYSMMRRCKFATTKFYAQSFLPLSPKLLSQLILRPTNMYCTYQIKAVYALDPILPNTASPILHIFVRFSYKYV